MIVIVILLCTWIYFEWPDEKLHLIFCDVGQGDSALIVLGSFQALVDTGAYEDKVLKCLSDHIPFWDRSIELVFLSHSDNDHDGALAGIKKHYNVGKEVRNVNDKDVIRYGMLYFEILKGSTNNVLVPMSGSSESNELSVVMKMSYGAFSVLFTGDIDLENELALLGTGVLRPSQVLKVSHHGSKYASGDSFLEAVVPKYSIVSVGAKNSYGHPSSDTLIRLDTVKTKVLRTDLLGTIEFISDGTEMSVYRSQISDGK
jgi:competence protein ComEC